MRDSFLSFSPPAISDEEREEVMDTLSSNWITTGPKTRRFESLFAKFIGVPSALALNSCTAGLHAALLALGIGPGDDVITTPMTFCSSVNVIEHVGARPILVDVEPDTLCISPCEILRSITPSTKCILPVHYGGHPCDMKPILSMARSHGLAVIEDAAHAITAEYEGNAIGTLGDLTAFSFYATKNLTTAEGGMLTGRQDLLDRARIIGAHGMTHDAWKRYDKGGSWYYEVTFPGFKYNMTDIQASIGLRQLGRLDSLQKRRQEVAARYDAALGKSPYFEVPTTRSNVKHAWHLYPLRLNLGSLRIDRAQFIEELRALNIGTSVHFIPVHLHPYYRNKYGFTPDDYPVACNNYLRLISIPMHPGLLDSDVDDVIGALMEVAAKFSR